MTKLNSSLLNCAILLLLFSAFGALGDEQPDSLTREWLNSDKRLNASITLSHDRIYLADLLSELSRQTGIAITMDSKEPVSSAPIYLHANKLPVYEILNGLWSLLGYQNATLRWKREENKGVYSYRLDIATFLKKSDILKAAGRARFRKQYDLLLSMSKLTQEARKQYRSQLAEVLLDLDTQRVDSYLSNSENDKEFWETIRLYTNLLTDNQREQALHGHEFSFTKEQIPADLFKVVGENSSFGTVIKDGVAVNDQPNRALFRYYEKLDGLQLLTPALMFELRSETMKMSTPMIGFTGNGIDSILTSGWLLQGDARASLNNAKKIVVDKQLGSSRFDGKDPLEKDLNRMSKGAGLSIIAIAPDNSGHVSRFYTDKILPDVSSVDGAFHELQKGHLHYIRKWRENLMLVVYPAWLYGDDALVPMETLDNLRKARAANGCFSFKILADTNNILNDAQLNRLYLEFPELKVAPTLKALIKVYSSDRALFSEDGIEVEQSLFGYLKKNRLASNWANAIKPSRMRVQEEFLDISGKIDLIIHLEFRDNNGWRQYMSFDSGSASRHKKELVKLLLQKKMIDSAPNN